MSVHRSGYRRATVPEPDAAELASAALRWCAELNCDLCASTQLYGSAALSESMIESNNSMTPARFLVVDDDVVVREMFADALRREGHAVHTAATAAAALDEVGWWHPDAILIDYRMGLINGVGFLYRLRAHESAAHTPVAVITGQVDLEDTLTAECAGLGAAVYFKPLRLDALREIARGLLTKIIH